MLPESRNHGDLFAIPQFTLEKNDVEDFMTELQDFHGEFADCFARSEPRENFFRYMAGQFSELERKSIEPIALKSPNGDVRSMQRLVSEIKWDGDKILYKYRSKDTSF